MLQVISAINLRGALVTPIRTMCTYIGFYKGKRIYPLIAPEIYFKVKSLPGGSELMSFEL